MDRFNGALAVNADPATGTQGTAVDAAWVNALHDELRNVIVGAGVTPDEENWTQLLESIRVLAGRHAGYRNAALNGSMAVWQRGTSFACSAIPRLAADRWRAAADQAGGTGAATVSRVAFGAGQTDVPGNPAYYTNWTQTTASSAGAPSLATRIEAVQTFAGQQVTVSAWIKAAGSVDVLPTFTQNFGSGGSSAVAAGQSSWSLSTAWQRYTWTVTLPSITGKTIGAGSFLELGLVLPTGVTFAVDVANVQVELGATATDFEMRPFVFELALCQRFYEKSYRYQDAPGTATDLGAATGEEIGNLSQSLDTRFRVEKATTPSVAWYAPSNGALASIDINGAASAITGATLYPSASSTGQPRHTLLSTTTVVAAHWTAEAEL